MREIEMFKKVISCGVILLVSVCFLNCEGMSEEVAVEERSKVSSSKVLMLDDFDDGAKPNNLGGDLGSWNKTPNDPTQFCHDSFDSVIKINKTGYSLKLDYDVDSPSPAYNGFWSKLNVRDLSSYSQLVFYVKGDKAAGYTEGFKVELKNKKGKIGSHFVKGVTDNWQRIVVPFSEFAGITEWDKMTEFVIVFDDITVTEKVGTIYIDDIYFQ